jgi:hypothetical protein
MNTVEHSTRVVLSPDVMDIPARIGLTLLLTVGGCAQAPSGPDDFVRDGTWGGDHVVLTIDGTRAVIEFDCAHGTLPVPIALDRGQFDITGAFALEHGGPIREDENVIQQPARYSGAVDGGKMTLRVRLVDGLQDLGSYTLSFGTAGRVFKCL